MNKKLEYLLRDINVVRKKAEEREAHEDNFNLFTILKKDSDERYLHSRFLSSLLDSRGVHKMGDLFLSSFLQVIKSRFEYSAADIEVYPHSSNWSEYKNIDIFLIDRSKRKAVIIENKINALDSNHEDEGQLERYYRRIIEEDKLSPNDIEVYYLTPDGHEPSPESLGTSGKYPELKDKVQCISYPLEILAWLKSCVKESYGKPALRESIIQYTKLIKNMTNNSTTEEDQKELIRIIGSNEDNLLSSKMLIENFCHVKWYTLSDFWKELSNALTNQGYKVSKRIEDTEIDDLIHHNKRDTKLNLIIATNQELPVYISAQYNEKLILGIFIEEGRTIPPSYQKSINNLVEKSYEYRQDGNWLCRKYISKTEIYCSDFLKGDTFKLTSPQYRHEVIGQIVSEINVFVKELSQLPN